MLRKIGWGLVPLLGLGLIIFAIGSRTCGWVPSVEGKKEAIASGDTAYAVGRSFECVFGISDGPGLVVTVAGLALIGGLLFLLLRDWKTPLKSAAKK